MTSGFPGIAAEAESSDRSSSWLRVFAIIAPLSLIIALLDLADGQAFLGDIDDKMRELQIRHLFLGGGHWFDLSLPVIATPEPYTSPWSRLIDLPFVAIAYLLSPAFGPEHALQIAFHIWPPVMLIGFSALTAMFFSRLMRSGVVISYPILVISIVFMTYAIWEFVPTRIDHHNMQILGLLMIGVGLERWSRGGGILMGIGTMICIIVGLEGLPLIAVAFLGLVGCFIFQIAGSRDVLLGAAATILVLTLPAAFAFIGPAGIRSTQCDSFSAPYIVLALGCSSILLIGGLVLHRQTAPIKIAALTAMGGAFLGVTAYIFPRCLSGPYWMIDPLSRHDWLDRVPQEFSFIYYFQHPQFTILMMLGVLLCIAIAALPAILRAARRGNAGLTIVFAIAVASLAITLLQTRNIRFTFAFVPLFLPYALQIATVPKSFGPNGNKVQRFVGAALVSVIAIALLLRLVFPPQEQSYDAIDYMAYSECEGQDFSVLSSVAPGKIAVPAGLSLPLAFALPPGFSVAALPFHRASPGMKHMFELFTSADSEIRREAAAPFDYVAVCAFPLPVDASQAPVYAALAQGGSWPGLIQINNPSASDFKLFRIDHQLFR
ncbi:hypothetical protein AB4Z25_03600 [Rhizobium sp. RAF36]|uniref:hypothetical protein n=1 Tax=Rhizobium sp. RAF36 TaxID=3233055 RepID=UPI000DD855D4